MFNTPRRMALHSNVTNGDKHATTTTTKSPPAAASPPTSLPTTTTAATATSGRAGDDDTSSEGTPPPGSEGTGDSGKNKLDNGDLSSPDDNNLYEEPQQPERPKVPPTAAKRTELPTSLKPSQSDGSDKKDVDNDDDEKDSQTKDEDDSDLYSSPPSNRPVISPPANTMYHVQATHRYNGEDVDELTFDPGEVIYVIPFENPEEQDDGWQMGIKQSDGIKGVFPENFTTRLESS
ncbi:Myc box-dependent-interacting protein 1 [Elysia marginata]|uniref:Myc box-dependent-interacting protein 1 n=1 Tax=Elysia marginata TaxID=1093978 RepID=A0AAV4HPM5_9GAST|nr:Myc box-dependent-interacting protein 1 [Elysia marginata]